MRSCTWKPRFKKLECFAAFILSTACSYAFSCAVLKYLPLHAIFCFMMCERRNKSKSRGNKCSPAAVCLPHVFWTYLDWYGCLRNTWRPSRCLPPVTPHSFYVFFYETSYFFVQICDFFCENFKKKNEEKTTKKPQNTVSVSHT